MTVWNRLFAVLFAAYSVSAIHGSDIILRLAPSGQATIVGTIKADSPEIQAAQPVTENGPIEHNWKHFDYTQQINGYLPAGRVSKNFELTSRSPLYVKPDKNSQVLTFIQPADPFEIIRNDENWFYIRLQKMLPVFFQEATSTDSAPPAEVSASSFKHKVNPDTKIGNLDLSELAPETVIWKKAPPSSDLPVVTDKTSSFPTDIIVSESQTQTSELPRNPSLDANTPLSELTGILVREISNTGPRYPIRLKSSSVNANIYVDLSQLFISDLRPFLDQPVKITGKTRPLVSGSRDQVIQAQALSIIE